MGMAATVKHRTPGRLRMTLRDAGQDDLKSLVDHFRGTADVQAVESNLLTKTLLIKAQSDEKLQAVLDKADAEGLFELTEAEADESQRNSTLTLQDVRSAIDRFFRDISDNRLDFNSGMAVIMVGLGLRQLWIGKFLPAGLTLVFYALGLLQVKRVEGKN
jgi:hypothetical protein